jgi:hypothetical protein
MGNMGDIRGRGVQRRRSGRSGRREGICGDGEKRRRRRRGEGSGSGWGCGGGARTRCVRFVFFFDHRSQLLVTDFSSNEDTPNFSCIKSITKKGQLSDRIKKERKNKMKSES